ncbi:MAG: DNA-3-methyladenine glycosylase family protein, partial [Solirubrobacteraceae bacterium]
LLKRHQRSPCVLSFIRQDRKRSAPYGQRSAPLHQLYWLPPADRSTRGEAVETASGLDIDAALAHLAATDPVMAALMMQHRPDSTAWETDLFRSLVSSIVSQQLSSKAADSIMRRVVATVAPDGEITPEALLAKTHEELRAAGLSNAKARYLRSLAELVSSGELRLEALRALDDAAVIEQLTKVKGIGRWTAEMFLVFSLGRPDVFSAGDLGIRNAIRRHYGIDSPTLDELVLIAEPWRPYRSTALLLLWRSSDNAPPIADGTRPARRPPPPNTGGV